MKKRVKEILNLLDEHYKEEVICYLDHHTDWQLLIATMLSAQCTDARVNIVTKDLFKKFTSIRDFAEADITELENCIKSTGFYHNKAKNIILASRMLLENYDGIMPSDIDELTKLPGVGRKTANVIRTHIFNIPSVVVDTHVKRISKRLGFTKNTDPDKIEFELYEVLPKEHWSRYNTQIIAFGREICKARNPKCNACFLREICNAPDKKV